MGHNVFAHNCLKFFAYEFGQIYGSHHLVYCVHNLINLSGDCFLHGPLDEFSALPFETFLSLFPKHLPHVMSYNWGQHDDSKGQLKKSVRSPKNPVKQIIKRISEQNNIGKPTVH